MKTHGRIAGAGRVPVQRWPFDGPQSSRPAHLHLVTAQDIDQLRNELARGNVPADLETKLRKLALGELGQRFIAQNCRTMIALIEAVETGSFKQAGQVECERLLRVLAYVRKDDDAIPDYQPGGFVDDQKEVRLAATELGALLERFKAWRLQHQVPAMWAPLLCAHPGQNPARMVAPAGRLSAHACGGQARVG